MTTSFINTQFDLYPGGHATGGFTSSAQTDNSGHAHLILFPADNLRVSASPPFGNPFAPGTTEIGSVTADSSATVRLRGTNTFSGVLRDRDGNPLAGQQISLQGSPFGAGDQTGSDGSFTIHAAPGTYTLAVFAMGIMPMPGAPPPAAPTFYSVSGPQIDLSNGDVHQDLTLPTLKLDVSVLDPDGAPVAGAGVGLFQQFAAPTPETPPMTTSFINTQFDLYPGGHATGGFTSSAQTDNSGHAHLILFPADNLRVSAQRSGFPPVVEELGSVTQDTSVTIPRRTAPRDTTPPAITPHVSGTQGAGDWYTSDVSVTWDVADAESGIASSTGCDSATISTDTAGTTLTCSATNGASLHREVSVTIKRDTHAPQISHTVTPSAPDGQNGWYVSAPTVTFACTDEISGVASCVADGGTGASRTLGEAAAEQSVAGTARDNAGNEAQDSATGLRVDLSDPAVTCDGAPTFLLRQTDAKVSAAVSDASSGPVAPTLTNDVATAAVGTFTTSFTGRDRAGRTTTVTCPYSVIYDWSGFFTPVGNTGMNSQQPGSAVPLKFSLKGNQGLAVLAAGYPQSQPISCDTGAAIGPPAQAVSAGASSLSYDASTDTYTWVWKTDAAWSATCRQLILKLNDGTSHTALFKFG
jgi:hypothetical protein